MFRQPHSPINDRVNRAAPCPLGERQIEDQPAAASRGFMAEGVELKPNSGGQSLNARYLTAEATRASESLAKVQLRHTWRLQAIADLAPALAHEFNNLMLVISARTLLVAATASSVDKLGVHLQAIDESAERAREMARVLLALTSPEQNEWSPIDVPALITESATVLRRLMPQEVRVCVDMPRSPLVLHANADMLRQLLLHCAARVMSTLRDGGELMVVMVAPESHAPAGSFCRISVSARPDVHSRRPNAQDSDATHLLAIESIAADHGGVVGEQPLGPGTRIDILLPVRREAPRKISAPAGHDSAGRMTDRWLLLVSADEKVQERVAEAILSSGFSLVTVASVDSPQIGYPCTGPMSSSSNERPSGVILDLSSVKASDLPPHLASVCRDLPCLVVDSRHHGKASVRLAAAYATAQVHAQVHAQAQPLQHADRGITDFLSRPAQSPAHRALHTDFAGAAIDCQVVQRWVDQITRFTASSGSQSGYGVHR